MDKSPGSASTIYIFKTDKLSVRVQIVFMGIPLWVEGVGNLMNESSYSKVMCPSTFFEV